MGTVVSLPHPPLLFKGSLFSAGHNQLQSKMRVLLLVALASQVHGRPQHMDYQPGNAWDNTRPAQPTEWSAWSSVGSGAPSPYNNYDSYNNYNPYSNYGPYIPGQSKQPYLRSGVNSVPGSVGGPVVQDIGLNQQGSLPGVEVSRGDIGDPQITNNVEDYQGWNTLPARPSFNPEPPFPNFPGNQPATPCSGGARPSPCGTGRCPSPWGGACASACSSPCSSQPGLGPMPAPMPQPMPMPMPQPVPMPQPMPMPQPAPLPQPGNCGTGSCGQMPPPPSRCQLGSGPQMGPLLGPIATTGCGASDRNMPTFGAPSNSWMPGNGWMTRPWRPQPMPMPMPAPMPEPAPSGQEGDCNSCGK